MDTEKNVQIYKIMKEKIGSYFEEHSLKPYANQSLTTKIMVFAMMMVSGYILLLVYGKISLAIAFFCYLTYMLGSTLLVVNIAHDASHQALSASKSVNRVLSYSWNLLGISKHLWEIKHHHSHHIYTNIPHQDVDIAESPLLRFSPMYPYRPYYKYQYLYAPVLYLFFSVFIVYIKDFVLFFQLRKNPHNHLKLAGISMVRLVLTKLIFLVVSFIVPLLVLPFLWWQTLLICLACMAICGSLMLLVLAVPHINEEAALYDRQVNINNQNEWALLQIYSTVDSSSESRLLNWLSGGLNTHLVHHLFPNICHVHYMALTRLIKTTLQEKHIEYKEKSFAASLIDHFRYLKLMGQNPSNELTKIIRPTHPC